MTKNIDERLFIIPDVHGRSFWRDAVKRHPEGNFIFLGDYLDPYPSEEIEDKEAVQGLRDIIQFKKDHPNKVILLWGNHDLHYLYPDELLGWRYDADNAERNAHLFWDNQELFQIAHETEAGGKRFLFSHAGVGRHWLEDNFPGLDIESVTAELLNDLTGYPPFMSALGDTSFFRGGGKLNGSMVWADVHEFEYEGNWLPGTVQVFGHTQMDMPVNYADRAYCLDCRQAFYLDFQEGDIHYLRHNERVGHTEAPNK